MESDRKQRFNLSNHCRIKAIKFIPDLHTKQINCLLSRNEKTLLEQKENKPTITSDNSLVTSERNNHNIPEQSSVMNKTFNKSYGANMLQSFEIIKSPSQHHVCQKHGRSASNKGSQHYIQSSCQSQKRMKIVPCGHIQNKGLVDKCSLDVSISSPNHKPLNLSNMQSSTDFIK